MEDQSISQPSNSSDSNNSPFVPLKISLNFPSNLSAKLESKSPDRDNNPQEECQFITEFELKNSPKPRKIIPVLQNTWPPFTKKSESEVQATGVEPASNGITNSEHEGLKESEIEKLRNQIQESGREPSADDYEKMAVEEFGEALLRGMGWSEGKGINGRGPVAPFQPPKIVGRRGLGAKKP